MPEDFAFTIVWFSSLVSILEFYTKYLYLCDLLIGFWLQLLR